ncbi:MAG: bifunctional precorrin-2 dehydrogenase/sirohydrochlorin ferrochelatase [Methanosarcinaceae archaeon]|nr:bifunctional precorrin-2 dehydrogenase/sirohydrochlorin ferrochelatase [Methanosarcinaceae archaeon]
MEKMQKDNKGNEEKEKDYVPLMISLSGKNVVIFGGGEVAERKALRFMDSSNVIVYSPTFTEALEKANEEKKLKAVSLSLKTSKEQVEPIISDAFLVIPATSDTKLNSFITDLAKQKNILVNSVDGANEVVIPSTVKMGGLTIAISSKGLSPAATKLARMRIETVITKDFEYMIEIQNELRTYLKEKVDDQKQRQKIIWEILKSEEIWNEIKVSKESATKKAFEKAERMIKDLS